MYGNGSFIRGAFLVRERELVKKGINSEMEWNTEILRAREYLQTLYRRAHGTCHDIEPRRDESTVFEHTKGPHEDSRSPRSPSLFHETCKDRSNAELWKRMRVSREQLLYAGCTSTLNPVQCQERYNFTCMCLSYLRSGFLISGAALER